MAGWQKQPREKTVQGLITEALEKLCGHKVNLIGASRTDAGAHAKGQVANFKTTKELSLVIIKKALFSFLPPQIYIKQVKKVSNNFQARYSAKKKLYRYIILRRPSPFMPAYTYPYYGKLFLARMREAARYLKGRHNFRSFCDGEIEGRNPVRIIDKITISHHLPPIYQSLPPRYRCDSNDVISVDIEGRSFLCHMVRIIAGTLIEAGRGKISPYRVKEILEAKNRRLAGRTLPAKGLFLVKVYY